MKRLLILAAIGFGLVSQGLFAGDNWPQFRGPTGDGHSDAKGLPLTWDEQKNVKWKTPIHDKGWSSPVVWSNQIWLTTASEEGKSRYVICVDRTTGKILRDEKLFEIENPTDIRKFNSYASPTPVIEESRVYVSFGSAGIACLDTKTGKVLWERRDFVCNHFRGAGSSPIIYGNLMILNFDGSDFQFVVALDKHTGKTVWKTDRSVDYKDLDASGQPQGGGDFRKAFATPQVAMMGGRPVLLSSGAKAHYAYEPLTGKEIWRVEERGQHSAAGRPLVDGDLIYFTTGFAAGQLIAVKGGGNGVVTDSNVVWRYKKQVSNKPSPIEVDGRLYMIQDDGGVVTCLDAHTGSLIWSERAGGKYSASPVVAEGHIYFCGSDGKTVVLSAGSEFKVLAENHLSEGSMGSPAIAGKAIFLRTANNLYRIEE